MDLQVPYRYFTKSSLIILLAFFYRINISRNTSTYNNKLTLVTLVIFLFSDLILIHSGNIACFCMGLFAISIGKLCYASRFSNLNDISILKLLPFFLMCTGYVVFIIMLVYENLGLFFIPSLLYVFSCLILVLFAFLRKSAVSSKSYWLVGFGVFCFVISDTYGLLESFYDKQIFLSKHFVMLFYGLAQYLVILGLTLETVDISSEID